MRNPTLLSQLALRAQGFRIRSNKGCRMKNAHPRFIALLGAIASAVAFGSLFLTYATVVYLGDAVYPPNPGVQADSIWGTGWSALVNYGPPPIPLWFWLIPLLFLLSIFFPLSLFLVRLLWYLPPKLFMWISLATLPGLFWCLFLDSFLSTSMSRGDAAIFTFKAGAWLLLSGFCVSIGCSIYLWTTSKKVPGSEMSRYE